MWSDQIDSGTEAGLTPAVPAGRGGGPGSGQERGRAAPSLDALAGRIEAAVETIEDAGRECERVLTGDFGPGCDPEPARGRHEGSVAVATAHVAALRAGLAAKARAAHLYAESHDEAVQACDRFIERARAEAGSVWMSGDAGEGETGRGQRPPPTRKR